ncbi:ImmA/IrrE family metallo-endopeptidase [Hymenobacter wooponensis]|uniref:ImmA/IrrE family metallo-endopeptidase n=1 Tax=Hymenobacter wooponensis TaxID=1525360 RepID=A0A4Z0MFD4_9BACT|nr:ImmA/IrrE family metallo-endopeptidase [Hymenobacter wooponensis]TGD78231.1 ImmA/IrrE family metallo-endopeptidase [Hymenobacter wooponensis]
MNKLSNFSPNWVSPPGNTIAAILEEQEIPPSAFAAMMNLSILHANELLQGSRSVTRDIANKLSSYLGASTEFWIKRELQYQEAIISVQQLERKVWVSQLPVRDMLKFGWLSQVGDKFSDLISFFDVDNIESWDAKYKAELGTALFRKSLAFKERYAATAAWIRQGEIQAAHINCQPWNAIAFRNILSEIRKLTRQKDPGVFLPKLIDLCATCGVAVVVVRTPTGCFASGATKFISADKAVMQLSFRYLSDDQFWFTFFHEAGHLLLHGNNLFLEGEAEDFLDHREDEANRFSAEVLIPEQFRQRMQRIPLTKKGIVGFSMEVGVSPGIVVGQLQFSKRITPKQLNTYKRRYQWEN